MRLLHRKQYSTYLLLLGFILIILYQRCWSNPPSPDPCNCRSFNDAPPTSSERPPIQPTTLLVTEPGFHVFDSLYLRNGTIFLLSPPDAEAYDPVKGGGGGFVDVRDVPLLPLRMILSRGLPLTAPKSVRLPTEHEIKVIKWEERGVLELEGRRPLRLEGTTILVNDSGSQFLSHYYHLWVELLAGSWRSLVISAGEVVDRLGNTNTADPRRVWFSHADETQWKDHAGINGHLTHTIWPSTSYEHRVDWEERAFTNLTFVFDRISIVDRTAGGEGSKSGGPEKWLHKMNANLYLSSIPINPNWFQPLRRKLIDTLSPASRSPPIVPVITYISRQNSPFRRLRIPSHDGLVAALEELVERRGWILEVPEMQSMTKAEQFGLALRTTIIVGIHGNGLSHQLWMAPTPWSTVIEIFKEGGWCEDYAVPAQGLGHGHYGVWNNLVIDTANDRRGTNWVADFHGHNISVDGPVVAKLIEKRLEGWKATS